MALNRRPSLLASYHNHFSPERFVRNYFHQQKKILFVYRTSLAPYIFSLATPVSMGPHVDEHSKRSRYPTSIPLSIDVKKVFLFLFIIQ
jgi:ABC-type bacteriocin/lantibiotic exporter with double-glycine peptidase domain